VGFFVLFLLSALTFVASFSAAIRTRPTGRAELLVTTGILWHALTALPAFCLGLLYQLTALKLALTAIVLSLAAIGLSVIGRSPREQWADVRRSLRKVLELPKDALVEAYRDRTLIFPGLIFATTLIAYTAVVAYFAPSWRGWDALWYHEPIVGFAIQNHGFAPIGSPEYGLRKTEGYPRICEMLHLWFVIFTDRRLIDVTNSLVGPLLMLSTFLVVRRFETDTVRCMGWAVAVFLMPAVLEQLQSTYVDVHSAIFLVAATHYAGRQPLRLRDVALASFAITLGVGAKHMALATGGILTLIVFGRALGHLRERAIPTLLVILAGGLGICAMCAAIYLRNLVLYGNPFWPELKYENPALGIHWRGQLEVGLGEHQGGTSRLHMQQPLTQQISELLSVPFSWDRQRYGTVFYYGLGIAWLVIPFGLVSYVAALVHSLATLIRRLISGRGAAAQRDGSNLLVLFGIVAMVGIVASPALWLPRYHVHTTVLLAAALAWVCAHPNFSRFGTVAPNIVVFCSFIMFAWVPRWMIWPSELLRISAHSYPEREFLAPRDFARTGVRGTASTDTGGALGFDLNYRSGSPVVRETAMARERELTKGKILVYGSSIGQFSALFWNNRFSNKAIFVPDGPDFLKRAEAVGPTWIHASYRTPNYLQLKSSQTWEEVGPLNTDRWGAVFRRRK
jgi:hypothetical protein